MIRDLSVFKIGEVNKCETCQHGSADMTTWVDNHGHLMEETKSCRDGCQYYKPPLINTPDDYEVVRIKKNTYALRPIYGTEDLGGHYERI